MFQEQVKAEGEGGRQETSRDIKTPEDIEDEEEMETERKKHLLIKIDLAKKESTRYKMEYEGVKTKQEAKLKEKEDMIVSNLVPFLFCSSFVALFLLDHPRTKYKPVLLGGYCYIEEKALRPRAEVAAQEEEKVQQEDIKEVCERPIEATRSSRWIKDER